VVALVRDGGNLVAQAEREQHLGGGGHERDDAHQEQDMSEWREAGAVTQADHDLAAGIDGLGVG
jgi:hypothetical protein